MRVDPVARCRIGAGQALPDAGFRLAAAGAQPLRAHLIRHGHVDHDEPPVARGEFADHAAGDVGDDDEAVAHRRRRPTPGARSQSPCARQYRAKAPRSRAAAN